MGKDTAVAPVAPSVNYDALESARILEMQKALRSRMEKVRQDEVLRTSSLSYAVLSAIVSEQYDLAREELRTYLQTRPQYPELQERGGRYLKHCLELIQAIETKRNFPGLASLSLTKQQEMHERVLGHFNELKHFLSRMESLEREQKIRDVRSTAWFIRIVCQIVGAVLVFAFLLDFKRGIFDSTAVVFDHVLTQALAKVGPYLKF